MASGAEHRREAQRLIQDAAKVVRRHDDECPEADRMIAEAQVHATLAVAAELAFRYTDIRLASEIPSGGES